jgi:hypothetical protein
MPANLARSRCDVPQRRRAARGGAEELRGAELERRLAVLPARVATLYERLTAEGMSSSDAMRVTMAWPVRAEAAPGEAPAMPGDAGRASVTSGRVSGSPGAGSVGRIKARTRARRGAMAPSGRVYVLEDVSTGAKYVGMTTTHELVRFVKHCTTCRMRLVAARLDAEGPRTFRMWTVGRAYAERTLRDAEAFFMSVHGTLAGGGLNLAEAGRPRLHTDFELTMGEVDLSKAHEFLETLPAGLGRADVEARIATWAREEALAPYAAPPDAERGRLAVREAAGVRELSEREESAVARRYRAWHEERPAAGEAPRPAERVRWKWFYAGRGVGGVSRERAREMEGDEKRRLSSLWEAALLGRAGEVRAVLAGGLRVRGMSEWVEGAVTEASIVRAAVSSGSAEVCELLRGAGYAVPPEEAGAGRAGRRLH